MGDQSRVTVAGEALVDLVPDESRLIPVAAGSPVNVAVGLGRLGIATAFSGPLSTDGFGSLLAARLEGAGVDIADARRVDAPTTLAVVHLDEGHASYRFYLDGTSASTARPEVSSQLPAGAALHVSFGALSPLHAPAGVALRRLIASEAGRRVVSLDPNVRALSKEDRAATVTATEEAVAHADIVKASDEDLAALYPDHSAESVAAFWHTRGPSIVVLTRGSDGAVAFGPHGRIEVEGVAVAVVDTIGAGDGFSAGLLAHLSTSDQLYPAALRDISTDDLRAAVHAATRVAALTCTRAGAELPTAEEVTAAFG